MGTVNNPFPPARPTAPMASPLPPPPPHLPHQLALGGLRTYLGVVCTWLSPRRPP